MEQSDIVEKAQDSLKKLASTGIGMSLTAWDEVSNNLLECTTEITRLRAALAEKMVVRAKPLVFSEFKAGGCVGRPYEFQYFVTEQHNGMFFAHFDESSHDTLEAAKAHCQAHYQNVSIDAVPASQIRAEALREAAAAAIRVIKDGKQSRRDSIVFDVEEAILALIDAPKVTTSEPITEGEK